MDNVEFSKVCTKCKIDKPYSAYVKESRRTIGITSACKLCINPAKNAKASTRRESLNAKGREYRKNNPEKNRARKLAYHHKKMKECVLYRLKVRVKSRMHDVAKRKTSKIKEQLLGCTISEYKLYMEGLFQPGMNWDNNTHTGWHIDHIKPLASFDLADEKQLYAAFHYTNTQPLWASDNLKKKDKLDYKVEYNNA